MKKTMIYQLIQTSKILRIFSLFILSFFSTGYCFESVNIILSSLEKDLFSDLSLAIGCLDYFNSPTFIKCCLRGITIDFGKNGPYYEPIRGDNYWQYYFEPIKVGEGSRSTRLHKGQLQGFVNHSLNDLSLSRAHEIIEEYIHVKPFIQSHVDSFYAENFNYSFVIGLHYNGTVRPFENSSTSFEKLYLEILNLIQTLNPPQFKIFLSTSNPQCIAYFENKFPGLILRTLPRYNTPFWKGEKLVVDCLLMSKCNFLLRSTSDLSYVATQFNPNLAFKDIQ